MRWLLLCLLLSGCGIMSWLPFGGSSGPTVNSNAQIGAENRQAVMSVEQTEEITAGRDVVTTEVLKEIETGMVEKLNRSEEHTSELQSPVPISYAVFCLKKKKNNIEQTKTKLT